MIIIIFFFSSNFFFFGCASDGGSSSDYLEDMTGMMILSTTVTHNVHKIPRKLHPYRMHCAHGCYCAHRRISDPTYRTRIRTVSFAPSPEPHFFLGARTIFPFTTASMSSFHLTYIAFLSLSLILTHHEASQSQRDPDLRDHRSD